MTCPPKPTAPEYTIKSVPPQEPGEVSTHLYGQITEVLIGDPIILNLSAVNPIMKPDMTLQLILKIPSGMSVISTVFVTGGAGQYTATYELKPGDIRNIEVQIMANQAGEFTINGDINYYFGRDVSTAEGKSQSIEVSVKPVPGSSSVSIPSTTSNKGRGITCAAPAPGSVQQSGLGSILGLGPIGLIWGMMVGLYDYKRWRKR